MSERLIFRSSVLPREVVVVDERGEKKIHLLKCSRRRLGELLEAALLARGAAAP